MVKKINIKMQKFGLIVVTVNRGRAMLQQYFCDKVAKNIVDNKLLTELISCNFHKS